MWKKLYGGHVRHCAERVQDVEQVLRDITSDDFVFSKYLALFLGFDFDVFKTPNWPKDMTPEDHRIWGQIEVRIPSRTSPRTTKVPSPRRNRPTRRRRSSSKTTSTTWSTSRPWRARASTSKHVRPSPRGLSPSGLTYSSS